MPDCWTKRERTIQRNYIRTCLASSTWRTMTKRNKKDGLPPHAALKHLKHLDRDWFFNLPRDREDLWTEIARKARFVARDLKKHRIFKGDKQPFGYAVKAVSLYMRMVVLNRELTDHHTYKRLRKNLPCPIDSYIFKAVRKKGGKPLHSKIYAYDTDSWITLQHSIAKICKKGYDPIDFDFKHWTER